MAILKVVGICYGHCGTKRLDISERTKLLEDQGSRSCQVETNIFCALKGEGQTFFSTRLSLYTGNAERQTAWLNELREKNQLTLVFPSVGGDQVVRIFQGDDGVFCEIA